MTKKNASMPWEEWRTFRVRKLGSHQRDERVYQQSIVDIKKALVASAWYRKAREEKGLSFCDVAKLFANEPTNTTQSTNQPTNNQPVSQPASQQTDGSMR